MKKILIILLTFALTYNSSFCYASDDFDYGINTAMDMNSNTTFTVADNTTGTVTSATIDFVPLFNRSIIVPIKENVSALIRDFCNMCTKTYDSAALYLASHCGENSNYTLTLSGNNYSLSVLSESGSVEITDIPEGEFSAYISNNDEANLSCNTNLLGFGLDTTPEEGYDINLTCYDKSPSGEKTNMWYWLGPVIGVVGAALAGGGTFVGYRVANGEDVLPG